MRSPPKPKRSPKCYIHIKVYCKFLNSHSNLCAYHFNVLTQNGNKGFQNINMTLFPHAR